MAKGRGSRGWRRDRIEDLDAEDVAASIDGGETAALADPDGVASELRQRGQTAPDAPAVSDTPTDVTREDLVAGGESAQQGVEAASPDAPWVGDLPTGSDPLRSGSGWSSAKDMQKEGLFEVGLEGYGQPRGAAGSSVADDANVSPFTQEAMRLAELAVNGDEDAARRLDLLAEQAHDYRVSRGHPDPVSDPVSEPSPTGVTKVEVAGATAGPVGAGYTEEEGVRDISEGKFAAEFEGTVLDRLANFFVNKTSTTQGEALNQAVEEIDAVGSGDRTAGDDQPREPDPDSGGETAAGDPLYDLLKGMQQDMIGGAYPRQTGSGDIDPVDTQETRGGTVDTGNELQGDTRSDQNAGTVADSRVGDAPTSAVDPLVRPGSDDGVVGDGPLLDDEGLSDAGPDSGGLDFELPSVQSTATEPVTPVPDPLVAYGDRYATGDADVSVRDADADVTDLGLRLQAVSPSDEEPLAGEGIIDEPTFEDAEAVMEPVVVEQMAEAVLPDDPEPDDALADLSLPSTFPTSALAERGEDPLDLE